MKILHVLHADDGGGGPVAVRRLMDAMGQSDPIVLWPDAGIAIRRERPDLVHTHGWWAGLVGRFEAHLAGLPAVHTFHGLPPFGRLRLAQERAWRRWTSATVHVAEHQAREGARLGLPGVVIPNGVPIDEIRQEAMSRMTARAFLNVKGFVVGTACRNERFKRVDLVQRYARERHGIAVILGHGHPRGYLPEAWRVFRAFDVYATFSEREGCPLGLLEALALGVECVTSDIPAHQEVLARGVTDIREQARAHRDLYERVLGGVPCSVS